MKFIVALFGLFILGCQKQKDVMEAAANSNAAKKIEIYLEKQISQMSNSPIRLDRLTNLQAKILYTSLKEYKTSDNQKLYLLNLSETTYPLKNQQKQIIIFYTEGENIKTGYVITADAETLKKESLINLLSNKNSDLTGTIELSTLYDKFIRRTGYENGSEKSNGILSIKDYPVGAIPSSYCVDWFLVTTYYYPDGTTYTTTEYAFTTCGCSSYLNESLGCDDPNGSGGGGNEQGFEVEAAREQNWHAYYGNVYGTWTTIWQLDKLKGKRNSSEPQGGHFTNNIDFGASTSQTNVTWDKTFDSHTYSNQSATSRVIVRATKDAQAFIYSDKTKNYTFSEVFP